MQNVRDFLSQVPEKKKPSEKKAGWLQNQMK